MKTIKDYIIEATNSDKPFSKVEGISVKYGSVEDVIDMIDSDEYVYGGKDSESSKEIVVIIDLPGRFNKQAWQGHEKPKRTYSLYIVFKKGGVKWYECDVEDVLEIKAVYYNRYNGTYSYGSDDIKDTKNIPIEVN